MGELDTITWQALTAILTLLGLAATVAFWRRRGPAAGLRMLAVSLLPAAAYLTGTLRLLWRIGDAVVDWAARLVLSPTVWVGIALAGVSLLLFLVAGAMRRRGVGATARTGRAQGKELPSAPSRRPAGPSGTTGTPAGQDDDLADIEAILKRHGIS